MTYRSFSPTTFSTSRKTCPGATRNQLESLRIASYSSRSRRSARRKPGRHTHRASTVVPATSWKLVASSCNRSLTSRNTDWFRAARSTCSFPSWLIVRPGRSLEARVHRLTITALVFGDPYADRQSPHNDSARTRCAGGNGVRRGSTDRGSGSVSPCRTPSRPPASFARRFTNPNPRLGGLGDQDGYGVTVRALLPAAPSVSS